MNHPATGRLRELVAHGPQYHRGSITVSVGSLTVLVDDGGGGAGEFFAECVTRTDPDRRELFTNVDSEDCLRDLGLDDWDGAFRTLFGPAEAAQHRHRDILLEPEYLAAARLLAAETHGRTAFASSLGAGLGPKMQRNLGTELLRQCQLGQKQVVAWTREVPILGMMPLSSVVCFARDRDGLIHAARMSSAPMYVLGVKQSAGDAYAAAGCDWVISAGYLTAT